MAAQQTSFQKKSKNRIPFIPGTKPSVQNAQLLISSGIPSLDHALGGGVPVGTTLLVEEDKYGIYAKLLVKYFLSEGVVCGHSIFAASEDVDCNAMIHELPATVEHEETGPSDESGEKMTIAWRYQNLPTVQSSSGGTGFGHNFDLTKFIKSDIVDKSDLCIWTASTESVAAEDGGRFSNPAYVGLLYAIKNKIESGQFGIDSEPEKRNLLRIALLSLGSPLWAPVSENCRLDELSDLGMFFYCLRSLLRSAYAVCVITLPSHLYQNSAIIRRCQHLSDISVRLESFAGSAKETNPVFKDYHGLFHIIKLSAVNTLAPHIPESIDLAFKLKRRKFLIEKLHLPPELQETAQREQDDLPDNKSGSCSGVGSRNLDF